MYLILLLSIILILNVSCTLIPASRFNSEQVENLIAIIKARDGTACYSARLSGRMAIGEGEGRIIGSVGKGASLGLCSKLLLPRRADF